MKTQKQINWVFAVIGKIITQLGHPKLGPTFDRQPVYLMPLIIFPINWHNKIINSYLLNFNNKIKFILWNLSKYILNPICSLQIHFTPPFIPYTITPHSSCKQTHQFIYHLFARRRQAPASTYHHSILCFDNSIAVLCCLDGINIYSCATTSSVMPYKIGIFTTSIDTSTLEV